MPEGHILHICLSFPHQLLFHISYSVICFIEILDNYLFQIIAKPTVAVPAKSLYQPKIWKIHPLKKKINHKTSQGCNIRKYVLHIKKSDRMTKQTQDKHMYKLFNIKHISTIQILPTSGSLLIRFLVLLLKYLFFENKNAKWNGNEFQLLTVCTWPSGCYILRFVCLRSTCLCKICEGSVFFKFGAII